jgi:uncharacterized protein YjiS (DUF1127 family)
MAVGSRERQKTHQVSTLKMEMIMSTIFGTAAPLQELAGPAGVGGLLSAAKRGWVAYVNWRIERAAMDQLWSMSDRELKDIGLIRSEIAGAAKVERIPGRSGRHAPGERKTGRSP